MISTTVSPKIGKAMVTAVNRHNSSRQERLTVFYKAVEIIRSATQWPSGETREVVGGKLGEREASVYLRNERSGINLYLFVEGPGGNLMKRFFSKPFRTGFYNPETSFEISVEATEGNYLQWNLETRKALGSR